MTSTRILTALFVVAATAGTAFAQDKVVAKGQKVFEEKKCGLCHLAGDLGNKKNQSPVVLDGVGAKLSQADLREWILHAPEMAAKAKIDKKPPMKSYADALSKDEVDALVAFMSSLKK